MHCITAALYAALHKTFAVNARVCSSSQNQSSCMPGLCSLGASASRVCVVFYAVLEPYVPSRRGVYALTIWDFPCHRRAAPTKVYKQHTHPYCMATTLPKLCALYGYPSLGQMERTTNVSVYFDVVACVHGKNRVTRACVHRSFIDKRR